MYDIAPHSLASGNRTLSDFHIHRLILSPFQWKACRLPVSLRWKLVKFSKKNLSRIQSSKGVYTFLVQPKIANHPACSYLLYVGKTAAQTFKTRYGQYLYEKDKGEMGRRPHVTEMLQKWDGFIWFCYASIENIDTIDNIEKLLLTAYLPPTNKEFPAKVRRSLGRIFGT